MWFVLVGLVWTLPACGGGEGAAAEDGELRGRLTITGSSTVAPLASEIGEFLVHFHTFHDEECSRTA
jgi:ABC-type phosphate transport system substrate-binding protein